MNDTRKKLDSKPSNNENLKAGENAVTVTVTAENGAICEYAIRAT